MRRESIRKTRYTRARSHVASIGIKNPGSIPNVYQNVYPDCYAGYPYHTF
jgi:hypothetical protein